MANETAETPPKRGRKGLILWILFAVFALAGGASVPWILGSPFRESNTPKKIEPVKSKLTAIPFDNVVVNIGDERLNRYLRVKLMVAVDEADAREVTDLLAKQKAFLKNWLIGYLSDQSIQDVLRKAGANRVRREICEQFNLILYPNYEEKIADILFDEFHLQ